MTAKIAIKNLRLRAVIGINAWEREAPQEVIVNVELEYDAATAIRSDDLKDALDYHALKMQILDEVERSSFFLLEALANHVLQIVMAVPKVTAATVEVDKPHALRFADSVSVTVSATRP